jgi:hypothetical protein
MRAPIRMTHLVETAPYQFLFGWFLAWLWREVPQGSGWSPRLVGR